MSKLRGIINNIADYILRLPVGTEISLKEVFNELYLKDGYTWIQGETLEELAKPERVRKIKLDIIKRQEEARKTQQGTTLVDILVFSLLAWYNGIKQKGEEKQFWNWQNGLGYKGLF